MSQLGIIGTASPAPLPPAAQAAAAVASTQSVGWAVMDPEQLEALIRDALPTAHDPGLFARSALALYLARHADRPLVLWYAGDLSDLDRTDPDTLIETARGQLLASMQIGGELYIDHGPRRAA